MKLLLDTHVLLWLLNGDPLRAQAHVALSHPASVPLVSMVSLWQIVIKHRTGKLKADIVAIMAQMAPASKLQWLGVTTAHLMALNGLPIHQQHKDPFDHLVIAQRSPTR